MNATEIIHAFGGISTVAEITGSSRNAVWNWRNAGIPSKFWLTLIEAADRKGLQGITAEAVAWRPPALPRARDAARHAAPV